jgi:hypothetical protein
MSDLLKLDSVQWLLHLTTSYYILLHLTTSYYILLHLTTSYYILLHLTTSYYILLHLTTSYYILLHPTTSYYILLHLTTSYYIKLHPTTSYYILLHLTTSYYILLHLTTSYCILLHLTTSYYILLHLTTSFYYYVCVCDRVHRLLLWTVIHHTYLYIITSLCVVCMGMYIRRSILNFTETSGKLQSLPIILFMRSVSIHTDSIILFVLKTYVIMYSLSTCGSWHNDQRMISKLPTIHSFS